MFLNCDFDIKIICVFFSSCDETIPLNLSAWAKKKKIELRRHFLFRIINHSKMNTKHISINYSLSSPANLVKVASGGNRTVIVITVF